MVALRKRKLNHGNQIRGRTEREFNRENAKERKRENARDKVSLGRAKLPLSHFVASGYPYPETPSLNARGIGKRVSPIQKRGNPLPHTARAWHLPVGVAHHRKLSAMVGNVKPHSNTELVQVAHRY
jgi:hypothetical protein